MSQIPSGSVIPPAQSSSDASSTRVDSSAPNSTPIPSSSSSIPTSTTATTSSIPGSSSAASSSSSGILSSTSTTGSTTAASSATTSSTTSSRSRGTSSSSLSFVVETSDGQVFTRTSIVTVPFSTPTDSSNTRSSTGFIHNKGAVAGVATVAGVFGLVALFFLFTSFIRRRRARKLDREIDEAAAAAAAAQVPDFDDFDYTSGGTGYGHYSETSHGTYNQPPLSHETNHNLSDIPASYDQYGMAGQAAGAAGIGARGRSVRGGGAQDPFGTLANPPEQYEMYERRQSWIQTQGIPRGGPGVAPYDLVQAAGLNDGDPYAVARATSQRLNHSQSKSGMSGPTRSQSQGTSILPPSTESHLMPTPAPGYPGGQDTPYPPEKARYSASYAPGGGISTMPPDVNEEAYSGYQDQPSVSLDNPYSPGFAGPSAQDEHQEVAGEYEDVPDPHRHGDSARASLADDEDYGYNSGHRVLRVANE